MNIENNVTIIQLVIFFIVLLVRSINAEVLNSPNYYNQTEGWDNDGEKIDYCNRADVIKEDLRREKITFDDATIAKSPKRIKKNDSIVKNGPKEIGSIILGILARALSLRRLSGLPFDICYFDEQIKRSLCVEIMKNVEPFTNRRLIETADMKKLFRRHDYACKPISIHGFGYSKMMFSCPFKILFAYSLAWYIEGFHLMQSKSTNNRIYIFRTFKSSSEIPIGLPIGEINNIHLEKGSNLYDISRIIYG